MLKPFRKLARFASHSKGAKISLFSWIIVAIVLSFLAPSADDYSVSSTESSINNDTPSEVAKNVLDEQFPTDDGLPALLVFHHADEITAEDREKINELSEWFISGDEPEQVTSALPYHMFPENVQEQMYSDDGTTLIFNIALEEGLDSGETHEVLDDIRDKVKAVGLDHVQFEVTGPAGISADTVALFKNADFVLMIATIGLIFLILIVIYRSPLLALTPLIIAGIVYAVVDRILGLAGKYEWFTVDGSAVSIMLVLLFAVLTDYSLFIFSRYREELRKQSSKYTAMDKAIYHVSEPIFFSGGTIFLAMLTLFVTIFEPYNNFAPVFSVAVVVILIAGLTLIPSIFALMGRRAFWPFIPEVAEDSSQKRGFWHNISRLVKKRPKLMASVLLVILLIGVFNITTMQFSYNLMGSFPEDISSRKGFEILADNYPPGQLAPVNVVLQSEEPIEADEQFLQRIDLVYEELSANKGISSVSPQLTDEMIAGTDELPRDFLAEGKNAIKLQLILDDHPYDESALNTIETLRENAHQLLNNVGFSTEVMTLHFEGQTAEQVDVKQMNKRDMIILFSLVIVLLTIVLGVQTQSFMLPLLMMFTILLSYTASLGFGWFIFKNILGYESISYRLPVYTFVFMVALGIDYNIILVSRIREKAKYLPWKEAVAEGVSLTGGVIASAGLILAATFGVLMTQPLQELFLFGFTMALGILLTTFLIAVIFLPSVLMFMNNKEK